MNQENVYSKGCEVKNLLKSKTSVDLVEFNIQFGQPTHPMGSGRPPWAAGESIITKSFQSGRGMLKNLSIVSGYSGGGGIVDIDLMISL